MKRFSLYGLPFLALAWATASHSESSDSYQLAMNALKKGDCSTAITELKKYKEEENEKLNKIPEFRTLIDKQIKLCEERIKEKVPDKTTILGEMIKPPGKEDGTYRTELISTTDKTHAKTIKLENF